MKKFLSVLLTLALLFGFTAPAAAYAAEEGVIITVDDVDKVEASNVADGYMTNHVLFQDATGYYGLKPADSTVGDATITFSLDVETAGKYQLTIHYTAKTSSAARMLNYSVNGGKAVTVDLPVGAEWTELKAYKLFINLEAGENDLVISTPTGYEDGIKTPNIYAVEYVLKEAAAPVAETTTIWVDTTDENGNLVENVDMVATENLYDPFQTNRLYQGHGCQGIKPSDMAAPAKVTFSVDVETAGKYQISVLYAAKTGSSLRKFDVYVNDTLTHNCTVEMQDDWETVAEHKILVDLKAGENDVTLTSSADYDADTVKNINVYGIKYTLKEAAAEPVLPTTPEEILNALYALEDGQSLEGEYTLTGVIDSFKYTYDPNYSTIQLTIIVDGMTDKPVVCYKLGGEGIDKVEVGDTITVTGPLKNYKGTYEFNGSTLVSYEKAAVAPQGGYLGRANSYDWSNHASAIFSFASADETATASSILGQPAGTFGWWYSFVLEYNEANGTFVVTIADTLMDGVNAIETATLGYGKLAFMYHGDFANTDADSFNYFLEKATVGTEFYLVGDYDAIVATWDVLADTYLTTEKPESYWTKPVVTPEPTPTPDEPIVVEGTEYVVKKGDTLSEIAAACGATVKELAELNKIENPDIIVTGAKLVIPTFEVKRHIVVKGDTLSQIAKTNGCKVADLVKLNNIANPDLIVCGDVIVLP